jgi:hypothetical protein
LLLFAFSSSFHFFEIIKYSTHTQQRAPLYTQCFSIYFSSSCQLYRPNIQLFKKKIMVPLTCLSNRLFKFSDDNKTTSTSSISTLTAAAAASSSNLNEENLNYIILNCNSYVAASSAAEAEANNSSSFFSSSSCSAVGSGQFKIQLSSNGNCSVEFSFFLPNCQNLKHNSLPF